MTWDEEAARAATRKAEGQLLDWRADYPEAHQALQAIWKEYYGTCGHKRLAQMLILGRTAAQTDSKRE